MRRSTAHTDGAAMTGDPYAPVAEFYDVLSLQFVEPLREVFSAAIAGANPGFGPVVDVAAGTGLSTLLIADALPSAHVLAIEPSASLRAILTSRVVGRSDLRERVTILSTAVGQTVLPDHLGGAVVLGSIGHLPDDEREWLWRTLARNLGPGCPGVVQLVGPAQPEHQPFTRYASSQIGRRVYEGWGAAEPSGPRSVRWTMTYRILDEGQLVDERTIEQHYLTLGPGDLAEEAGGTGLDCAPAGNGLWRLRPR